MAELLVAVTIFSQRDKNGKRLTPLSLLHSIII